MQRLIYLADVENGYNINIRKAGIKVIRLITRNCADKTSLLLVDRYNMIPEMMKMLKYPPMSIDKFWIVSNLAYDVVEIVESGLMEGMVDAFAECVKDTDWYKIVIAGNTVYPLTQTMQAITNETKLGYILEQHYLIKYIMILIPKFMGLDQHILEELEYGVGDTIHRFLGLIEWMLQENGEEIQRICSEQIKENGNVLLNDLKDRNSKFNLRNYEESISSRASVILNAIV